MEHLIQQVKTFLEEQSPQSEMAQKTLQVIEDLEKQVDRYKGEVEELSRILEEYEGY